MFISIWQFLQSRELPSLTSLGSGGRQKLVALFGGGALKIDKTGRRMAKLEAHGPNRKLAQARRDTALGELLFVDKA